MPHNTYITHFGPHFLLALPLTCAFLSLFLSSRSLLATFSLTHTHSNSQTTPPRSLHVLLYSSPSAAHIQIDTCHPEAVYVLFTLEQRAHLGMYDSEASVREKERLADVCGTAEQYKLNYKLNILQLY